MPDHGIFVFVLWATLALVALAVIGFLAARWVRSWSQRASDGTAPFTLQDVRELRARGEISEAEYETMRAMIIGQVRRPGASGPTASRVEGGGAADSDGATQ